MINQPNGVLQDATILRYDPSQNQNAARYADVVNNQLVFNPRVRGVVRQPPNNGRTRVVAHAVSLVRFICSHH